MCSLNAATGKKESKKEKVILSQCI